VLRPAVRYARTDDGVAVAYSTVGDGSISIVFASPLISQLEIAWEEPAFEHFITRLATGARVVLFDRRGSGLSDHSAATLEDLDLSRLALDVHGVLDATGSERAVVIGVSLGGTTAVQYAFDHPERTSAIVLIASAPRLTTAPGYEIGIDPDGVDGWIQRAVAMWGTGASVEAEGPSMAGNVRYREWAARLERHTASPGDVETMTRAAFRYDVRSLLPHLAVPTLVVHRRDDPGATIEHGRYLAEHIPDATYVELPGQEHTYFLGNDDAILGAVRAFIDERVAGGAMQSAVRRAERRGNYGYGWDALTPSEREVATLVAQGLTNAEVADRLGTSRFTVDGRLRRIFTKLDVTTRVELTAEYARLTRS
jgi:pimeloyl-ACP methyl ester carboxylesterase/DNA-binding CsgD family transcriptional regulator